jgi:phosphopentomutase
LLPLLDEEDLLLVTADHGCDPTTPGTDHSREYVPLLVWNKKRNMGGTLGVRGSFADIAASLAQVFAVEMPVGESFLPFLRIENQIGSKL